MNQQVEVMPQLYTPSVPMVGESTAMQEIFRLVKRIGPTCNPVLIQGESGTGKEIVAKALHQASYLRDKPLVVVNCTASSESMLEIELFGSEKGALPGDDSAKVGLFEMANGGTLFIDKIGEIGKTLQAKLLRVLEDGTFRRVGSVRRQKVQVRLIAATSRDLMQEVKQDRFREDLLYRINVFTIKLPPLRERREDIVPLINEFCGQGWHISQKVVNALKQYDWPGNIHQLKNAIQRAKVLSKDRTIKMVDLPPEIASCTQQPFKEMPLNETNLELLNKRHISKVLQQFQGNKSRAAQALGVGRRTLYRLIKKFGIT